MSESLPYNEQKGCPIGYHKRTYKLGQRTSLRCAKSMTRRLSRERSAEKCPPGMISRKAYVRKFSKGLMERGYTVKRDTGVAYRIKPKHSSVFVKSGCVKKPGNVKNPGKLAGAMRKGELKKHGYAYQVLLL